MKVDYPFYRGKYVGTVILDEDSFEQPLLKANIYLNPMLCEEAVGSNEELVKLCLCELADLIYQDSVVKREHEGRKVQSENTDGYTVTYASEDISSLEARIHRTIDRYLSHTGLLYLGVG